MNTGRYDLVNIVVIGKNNEDNIAKREKERKPNDWSMSGSDMLEIIPRIPKRAVDVYNWA